LATQLGRLEEADADASCSVAQITQVTDGVAAAVCGRCRALAETEVARRQLEDGSIVATAAFMTSLGWRPLSPQVPLAGEEATEIGQEVFPSTHPSQAAGRLT